MALIRSIAHPRDDGIVMEGDGIIAERDATNNGGDSGGSPERTQLVQASDVGSHSWVGDECDKGSCTRAIILGLRR
jgi:hypothetical protein